MTNNFAIVEFKGQKNLFDYVPIDWLYFFDVNNFKNKKLKSFICFWHNDRKQKAPLKSDDHSTDANVRKDFKFYKVFVHYLYGKLDI